MGHLRCVEPKRAPKRRRTKPAATTEAAPPKSDAEDGVTSGGARGRSLQATAMSHSESEDEESEVKAVPRSRGARPCAVAGRGGHALRVRGGACGGEHGEQHEPGGGHHLVLYYYSSGRGCGVHVCLGISI